MNFMKRYYQKACYMVSMQVVYISSVRCPRTDIWFLFLLFVFFLLLFFFQLFNVFNSLVLFLFSFYFHLVHFHFLIFVIAFFFNLDRFLKQNQTKPTLPRADIVPKINDDGRGLTCTCNQCYVRLNDAKNSNISLAPHERLWSKCYVLSKNVAPGLPCFYVISSLGLQVPLKKF